MTDTYSVVREAEPTFVLTSVDFEHEPWEEYGSSAHQAAVWAEDRGLSAEVLADSRVISIVHGTVAEVIEKLES